MPRDKTEYFGKVKEAREALAAKALELYARYDRAIIAALDANEFEVAIKAMQWAIEHMPAATDGTTMIDGGIDRAKQVEAPKSPTINIGFKIGGISQDTKALPPSIEIIPITDKDAK